MKPREPSMRRWCTAAADGLHVAAHRSISEDQCFRNRFQHVTRGQGVGGVVSKHVNGKIRNRNRRPKFRRSLNKVNFLDVATVQRHSTVRSCWVVCEKAIRFIPSLFYVLKLGPFLY